MPAPLKPQTNPSNALDMRALALTLLKGWQIILGCLLVALLIAIVQLHFVTYVYSVDMRVTPVQANGNDNSPARMGSLNNLASLAGVSLPSGTNTSQFRLYVESMHSRDLANDIAQRKDIMKRLFAGEWDEATQSWRQPSQGLSLSSIIRPIFGLRTSEWRPPDGARVEQFLDANIVIVEDIKKPYLVGIRYVTSNPEFGVKLLSALDHAADDRLRRKAIVRAEQYAAYLLNQLSTVTVAEQRMAITQALSQQEMFATTANSAAPFSADIFDAPAASPDPISPQPRQIVLMALLVGAAFGVALILGLDRYGAMLHEELRMLDEKTHLQSKLPRILVRWFSRG
jgi:capsular polysaccharide biosynthesis protein